MPTAPANDPVPPSALPTFSAVSSSAPVMPAAWNAVALLHPFSPPLSKYPRIDNPFHQLCIAQLDYLAGEWFSIRVVGCEYGQWWYMINPTETQLSTDGGIFWKTVDMGWTLPTDWYGAKASTARCAGASPLSWMSDRSAEWWTIEARITPPLEKGPPPQPIGATWLWFDAQTKAPMRMMFGNGPNLDTFGDPTQLAFLQMFSFSYFTGYTGFAAEDAPPKPDRWFKPTIPGLTVGNPKGYKNFVWNGNSGLTAFMTPVNGYYNPLPTRVLYRWKDDADYAVYTDRVQDTKMHFTYNTDQPKGTKAVATQTAVLTGFAPKGSNQPLNTGTGFLYTQYADQTEDCLKGGHFKYGQEPPFWISIPAVQGTIRATIVNNPELCPGQTITIFSVLFPPFKKKYPEATYLWTWYAPPPGSDGTNSRPVNFMQSQSTVQQGTSLALADYYYYEEFSAPVDPGNLTIPACCLGSNCKIGPDDDR